MELFRYCPEMESFLVQSRNASEELVLKPSGTRIALPLAPAFKFRPFYLLAQDEHHHQGIDRACAIEVPLSHERPCCLAEAVAQELFVEMEVFNEFDFHGLFQMVVVL